jgi:pimeloyl-ACP methyl ester carboxylesterase
MGLSLYERARRLELVVSGERVALTAVHSTSSVAGRRVLLLHGNPRNLDDFVALFSKLDFAAEVLAIDLPGFGRSPPALLDSKALTLADLARVAFAAADAYGWSTFEIIGHSHGGGVAQAMAWNANPRVKRITVVGTLGTPAHTSYKQLALPGAGSAMQLIGKCLSLPSSKTWFRVLQRSIAKKAFHPEPVPPEHLECGVEAMIAAPSILRSMVRVALGDPCQALAENVASITCAVTFVHGELDALVPPRHARNLHELRTTAGQQSTFVLVPNAGHMLPLTHPELIAERARCPSDF